jgi:integrase
VATINTAKQAAAAKPGKRRVSGADGLYLHVGANGAGSWFFRYNAGKNAEGKPIRREMGLGSRTDVDIGEARQKAKKLAVQHDDGHDPLTARRRTRAAAKAAAEIEAKKVTFRHAAASYLEANAPTWKHRYARAQWGSAMARYAFPVLGDLLLENIEVDDIVKVMNAAVAAGFKETARRLRWEIFRVIERARALGQFDAQRRNPADAHTINHARPLKRKASEREHIRAVPIDDAPAVFQKIYERAENDTAFAAWVFMIATAARPSEALKADWSEIDLHKKLWTVPAGRMKKGRAHFVPLSSVAMIALERQAKLGTIGAIFPGVTARSLNYASFATAPTRAGFEAGAPHGWRSVFRDWAGDKTTFKDELAEFALAHVLGATVGAYRRSTGDRGAMMEAYAEWLLSKGADVIRFPARA